MAEPGSSAPFAAPFVIAIDGPAAAGKGTLARRLAEHLGYGYLDTGSLYRAVGIKTVRAGHDPADAEAAVAAARALVAEDLERPDLRSDEAAQAASRVAAQADVRQSLLDFQRRFASHPPGGRGAVLDGRDIGTVVCPDAHVKFFVTASLPVRACRRLRELRDRGAAVIHSTVLRDMKERDARDSERDVAPLRPAVDAYVIDTSDLNPDTVLAVALARVRARLFMTQDNAQENAQDKGGSSLENPGNPRP
jgi:cytidylate kinase